MKRALIGLLLCLSIVAIADAAPCTSTQCVTGAAVVAQPTVAVSAAQILVPVYGAVYSPPATQQNAADPDVLREILAELKAMRAELQALKQPTVLPLAVNDVGKALTKSCVKCHSSAAADTAGGGFALFDAKNELLTLAEADRKRITNRVSRNSMPPAPAKLSAADKDSILKAFQGK